MNKYYGAIGFAITKEDPPGSDIWVEDIVEHRYFGDVLRNMQRTQVGDRINGNPMITNKISILADPYAFYHYQYIRYAEWNGAKWNVTDIEVSYPRLILTLGGLYNEQSDGHKCDFA